MISGGYEEIEHIWKEAEALERKAVSEDEALVRTEVTVESPIERVEKLILRPEVMKVYLMSDGVDAYAGARGDTLDSEFHCHHGPEVTTMRVVSKGPAEYTLTADKPIPAYVTVRLHDLAQGKTRIERLYFWDEPEDEVMAKALREMYAFVANQGDAAMQSAFGSQQPGTA